MEVSVASIADQLIGVATQGGQQLTSNIKSGAELAQGIEQVQNQRAQLEQKKQELQMQKVDKLTSAMEAGAKMKSKSARNAFFKNYIPQMQAALGLQDFIPEATLAMIQADPQQALKFSLLKDKINNNKMTYAEATAKMDPEEWAMLDESEITQLEAAEKFRIQQSEATKRSGAPNARLAEQFEINKITGIKDSFEQEIRKDLDRFTAANNALALLNSNLPIADEASKTQLARLAGEVGALTEPDLQRFGGSKDLKERAAQLFATAAEGKLTTENRRQLKIIANEFKSIVEAKIRAQAERSVEGGVALGFDENKLRKTIGVDKLLNVDSKKSNTDWKKGLAKQKDRVSKLTSEEKEKYIKGFAEKFKVSEDEVRKSLGGK